MGRKKHQYGKYIHADSFAIYFCCSKQDVINTKRMARQAISIYNRHYTKNKHKMLIVNGMPDHMHIVIGMRPTQSISDLLQDIKGSSSKWINDNKLVKGKFQWQEGYAAFSYSKSALPKLIEYVKNQEEHHRRKNFQMNIKNF